MDLDPHIRKEVSLDAKGPLGNLIQTSSASAGPSRVNSRVGSRENLCEECIQNPLDLIDASIQVDLSDSEDEGGIGAGDDKSAVGAKDNAQGTMGRHSRSRNGADLGVNKKGTPLYSREDIREQYCINDKELQVLDKSQKKSFLGCFSNQGQDGISPCGRSGGKRSFLGSCIARTSSEDDLQQLDRSRRPISPGPRGPTWNGRHHYHRPSQEAEDAGFDEHYFRRRPKSFCSYPAVPNQPPYGPYGPPHHARTMMWPPPPPPPLRFGSGMAEQAGINLSMGSIVDEQRTAAATMHPYYGHHSLMRYPQQPLPPTLPPHFSLAQQGYTLPASAAFFPMASYSTPMCPPNAVKALEAASLESEAMYTQPNTPDLLLHRRQMGTPEVSLDERRSKHVSFDSNSLMRSHTLAIMDEQGYNRSMTQQDTVSTSSTERLIDGSKSDFEMYSELLPPELARQVIMDRVKKGTMRTQATQTSNGSGKVIVPTAYAHEQKTRASMVSESVQTNGFLPKTSSRDKVQHIPSTIAIQLPGYRPQTYKLESSQDNVTPTHSTFKPKPVRTMSLQHSDCVGRRHHRHHHHHHHHRKQQQQQELQENAEENSQKLEKSLSEEATMRPAAVEDTEVIDAMPELSPISNEQRVPSEELPYEDKQEETEPDLGEPMSPMESYTPTPTQEEEYDAEMKQTHKVVDSYNVAHLSGHGSPDKTRSNSLSSTTCSKMSSSCKDSPDDGANLEHNDSNKQQEGPPDQISLLSSSSGSYSVTTESKSKAQEEPGVEKEAAEKCVVGEKISSGYASKEDDKSYSQRSEASTASKRKQELTLDLDTKNKDNVSKKELEIISPDSNVNWHAVSVKGTGEVLKKKMSFEEQIRAQQSPSSSSKSVNSVRAKGTPVTRRIVSEERVIGSGTSSSPCGSSLARSPAMHEGFRVEDWIVQRTPVNTPGGAESTEILVGEQPSPSQLVIHTLNLSDEEDEKEEEIEEEEEAQKEISVEEEQVEEEEEEEEDGTSMHVDSDIAFKSGATTSPAESFHQQSYAESKTGEDMEDVPFYDDDVQGKSISEKESEANQQLIERESQEAPFVSDAPDIPDEPCEPEPPVSLPLVEPPAGFGDSPEHQVKPPLPPRPENIGKFNSGKELFPSDESVQDEEDDILRVEEVPECLREEEEEAQQKHDATLISFPILEQQDEDLQQQSQKPDEIQAITEEHYQTPDQPEPEEDIESKQQIETQEEECRIPEQKPFQVRERHHQTPDSEAVDSVRNLTPSSGVSSKRKSRSRSRSRSSSKERLLLNLAEADTAPRTPMEEDELSGIYYGDYKRSVWAFIGKLNPGQPLDEAASHPLRRSASIESTQSEQEFRRRHQAITHRMVHRKSSAVMYGKILQQTFECNLTVTVARVKGEFGFRIHGSRPVVVSAIESGTPAETSGLKVGDIILTINGVNVLDLSHIEVVRTAQTGRDELTLGLARLDSEEDRRTVLSGGAMNQTLDRLDDSLKLMKSGFLWRLSQHDPSGELRWTRRWFVLRADACLYFFKNDRESRPLGAFLLSSCQINLGCRQDASKGDTAFTLTWPLSSTQAALAAETPGDRHSWVDVINTCSRDVEEADIWMELSRRRLNLAALSNAQTSDCFGPLLKLDGKSKMWKKRFCVLVDACLYLYLSEQSTEALATLCLHGYKVQSVGSLGGNKRHAFELIPPSQELRYFYFVAETETEKKRWMASIEYSMDQWMKLSDDN